jgi:6-phosphofructokinase 1
MKRIAILTGGGDSPGLNAVIRSVLFRAEQDECEVVGILRGWHGLLAPLQTRVLSHDDVDNIQALGGTILLTSRINPFKWKEGDNVIDKHDEIHQNMKELECDALIVVGGVDTLGVAYKLFQEGLPVVGIPKTIDNDLNATDYTFGFDTAVNIATQAIDRLHTTARSHERVIVVELMGRHTGWMTLHAGLAGGAHQILIPEVPFSVQEVCDNVIHRIKEGKEYSLIAVAEGAIPQAGYRFTVKRDEKDAFDHVLLGGISEVLAREIQEVTGIETRSVILGHIQRGGTPTTFDRILATRLGIKAVELAFGRQFGRMASLNATHIVDVSLKEAIAKLKSVPIPLYEEAKIFCK